MPKSTLRKVCHARMHEKRAAMSSLVKMYQKVDYKTWLDTVLDVYEKSKS